MSVWAELKNVYNGNKSISTLLNLTRFVIKDFLNALLLIIRLLRNFFISPVQVVEPDIVP